ncbi:MAG: metallophosphoesterase [Anaerovoracaceae bacterium]
MFKAIGKLFKFILILILILVILAAGIGCYARFIEPNLVSTTQIDRQSNLIKEKLTIAVFADTHFGFDYDTDEFDKAIAKINEKNPDIVLFAGDLIDNLNKYANSTSEISSKLGQIKANVGKYAVFGNHDYGGGAEYKYENIMAAGGFKVLLNQSQAFDRYNLRLIGIDDLLIGYGDPTMAQNVDESKYNFVLCHEPDVIESLLDSNTNFMTSGHTHGGQINIPFYKNEFLPSYGEKYIKGEYNIKSKNNTTLYVNSGLGTTKLPVRFMAIPEITFITLSPAS